MGPQDPGVTGKSLVDRMDNSTRSYKITHEQLWVACDIVTVIRRIVMVRVSQRTLQSPAFDDWRYKPPLVFSLAGTCYGRGLKEHR
jgi:hypothetical protein